MNEHHLDDRLRVALDDVAGRIDLDLEPADVLARRGRRRRTRRRIVGGCAVGAIAIAIAGIVAVTRGNDDSVQTADDDNADPSTLPLVVSDADGADGRAADGDATIVTAPPTLPGTGEASAVEVASSDAARFGAYGIADALVPWQDGFLTFRTEYQPQPLGPLSDEVLELFPAEIRELFPDGLPPTVDQAMEVVQDADLMDEVWSVLEAHPEAEEAIFAQAPPPPTFVAEFTTDGRTWTPVDIEFPPMAGYPQLAAAPEGITVWAMEEPEYGADGRPVADSGARTLTIAHSTDLSSWSTATLTVDVPPTDNEYVRNEVWPSGVAASADRWVAVLQQNRWVDVAGLLPDDLGTRAQAGELDWSQGPDGVEIYRFDPEGNVETQQSFTWAELGVDPALFDELDEPEVLAYAGGFDGDVRTSAVPDAARYANGVFVVGDAFFLSGEQTLRSTDGLTWAPIDGVDAAWISAGAPLADDAALLIGDGPTGQRAWVVDADGVVAEALLPELPHPYGIWSANTSAAFIVESSEQYERSFDPITVRLEHDGYGVELTNAPEGSSYRVTELTTGDEVWFAEYTWEDNEAIEALYEFDEEAREGGLVFRDADGAVVLRVPDSVLETAYREAYPEEDQPAEEPAWTPDLWLIATANGVDWLTLDVADPEPEGEWYPTLAAVNGDRVLYQSAGTWALVQLPG